MTTIAMENGSFIDGLPINSMVIVHGELLNNQMVQTTWCDFPNHSPWGESRPWERSEGIG
jgi:hypothetical protein